MYNINLSKADENKFDVKDKKEIKNTDIKDEYNKKSEQQNILNEII